MPRATALVPILLTGCLITQEEAESWVDNDCFDGVCKGDPGWPGYGPLPDDSGEPEADDEEPERTPEVWMDDAGMAHCVSNSEWWSPLDDGCDETPMAPLGPGDCSFRIIQDARYTGELTARAWWTNGSGDTETTLWVVHEDDGTLGQATSRTGNPEVTLTVPATDTTYMLVLQRWDSGDPEELEATIEVCPGG